MIIPQSVYYGQHDGSNHMTWDIVQPTIWGQIAMNLAILTADSGFVWGGAPGAEASEASGGKC